jgi:hypothetical protein
MSSAITNVVPDGYSGGFSSFDFIEAGWLYREQRTRLPAERDFVPAAFMFAKTLGSTTYLGPRWAMIRLASEPFGGGGADDLDDARGHCTVAELHVGVVSA